MIDLLIFRHQSKVVHSLMTLISMMRRTTMAVLPWCLRKEEEDRREVFLSVCVEASNECPTFVATDHCLCLEETMMI